MDIRRKLTAINDGILELKETDQRIRTYLKSVRRNGLENAVEQFKKLEKRVYSLEIQYDQNQNSIIEVEQLSMTLLEKVEQLGNVLTTLQNEEEHRLYKEVPSESYLDSGGISNKSEVSISSRIDYPEEDDIYKQSNIGANDETMTTVFNLVAENDCDNIMCKGDTLKTDCNLVDNCICVTNYPQPIKTQLFKTTDMTTSVMPQKNQNADFKETFTTVSGTNSGFKDEKEKNICKSAFGYKRKFSNIDVDNRVKFHANMAAHDEKLISSNDEMQTKPATQPIASENIKPTMVTNKRSFTPKLDPAIPELECQNCIFKTDNTEQPREIEEWLELSRQTSAFFKCRIQSDMCKRGNGQNMILVLDCSERVRGKTFENIKELALQFVDGVEQVYHKLGLEDNIGLAVFGGQTKLVHESTSNYSLLRELIGQQVPEGDAPLLGGLLMGMSGVLAGPSISRHGCKIHGRMIVLTDGSPRNGVHDFAARTQLNKSYILGDFRGDAEIRGVIRMIVNADIKIYHVPVGKLRHNAALEQAVNDTNGKIVQPTEMYRLIRMSQVVDLAIEVACKLRNTSDSSNSETIARRIREDTDDPHDDCIDLVLEYMNPLSRDIRKGKFAELTCYSLQLGDRVRRGPDWRYKNQDSNMPGTVIGREDLHWVQVEWDSGQKNRYEYNENSNIYTLKKVNEPRRLTDEMVAVGCRVVRGPDWRFRDEDGGRGNFGTVLKVKENGTVVVRWDCKRTGLYNFGCNGVFEVMVCDDLSTEGIPSQINRMQKSTRHEQNSQSRSEAQVQRSTESDRLSNQTNSAGDREYFDDYVIPIYSDSSVSAVWEYMGDNSEWRKYPTEINTKIEKAYGRKSTRKIIIKMDMSTYIVHFTKMVQENPKTKKETPVRRND